MKKEEIIVIALAILGIFLASKLLLFYLETSSTEVSPRHIKVGQTTTFSVTCKFTPSESGSYDVYAFSEGVYLGRVSASAYQEVSISGTVTTSYSNPCAYLERCKVKKVDTGEVQYTDYAEICADQISNFIIEPSRVETNPGSNYNIRVRIYFYKCGFTNSYECGSYEHKVYINNEFRDRFYAGEYEKTFTLTAPSQPGTYTITVEVKSQDNISLGSSTYTLVVGQQQQFGYEFIYRWIGQVLSLIKEALSLIKPI